MSLAAFSIWLRYWNPGWNEPCSEEQDWEGSQHHWSSFTPPWWLKKILLPWPCLTRFYQELLSLYQLASRRHQHVEGGPEEDGCGGQVVQEVVEQHPQISLSVVTFLRAGNRKQWTNSLSKQRVWKMRPASALNLNQDSHEAILYSKSQGRWARQRPRRRVRGHTEGKDLRLHNQKWIDSINKKWLNFYKG